MLPFPSTVRSLPETLASHSEFNRGASLCVKHGLGDRRRMQRLYTPPPLAPSLAASDPQLSSLEFDPVTRSSPRQNRLAVCKPDRHTAPANTAAPVVRMGVRKNTLRKHDALNERGRRPNTESAAERTESPKPTSYVRIASPCDLKGSSKSFTGCCRLQSYGDRLIDQESSKQ